MSDSTLCDYLDWDSQFFGKRIARAKASCLTEESVSEIEAWCRLHKIDCLYFLANFADQRTTQLAQDNLFRFVDVRVTFDLVVETAKGVSGNSSEVTIRNAEEDDIQALRLLARNGHRDSRFYYDGNFPVSLCDELYEIWIEKSCRGWANRVLVATQYGQVNAYLTCHLPNATLGQIGLIAVGEKAQGKGIGRSLVLNAIRWFAEKGVCNVKVVTQGRNVRAQRFYEQCGFTISSAELWFHRWWPSETWNRK
jgi:dTDP-4-amino-4,6-dideoxy-D-galactose acyltransferase